MGLQAKVCLLLLVLISVSLAGCTAPSASPAPGDQKTVPVTQAGKGPFQDITSRNPPKVSLGDALGALAAAEREGAIDTRGMTIHQVFGYGVDSSGLGRTWVLGMQRQGTGTLFEYSAGEWKELDLAIPLPDSEVKIAELMSPQDLYRKHLKAIASEMNRLGTGESDLLLGQDTYTLTFRSAIASSTLTFNAKTGELVPSA